MADLTNIASDASSSEEADVIKQQALANDKMHKHLSTVFVIVGIVSFTLGAIVNWYTIQRIKGGKI